MKKLYSAYFIALAFILTLNVNAQTNVTSSGMSIQGIARDETNAAIANIDQLALVFTVYYFGTGNSEQPILTKTANVKTDNFGVFSYVMDIDQLQYGQISSQSTYLKVTQGSTVFSNEKLQAVPYAIFAQNGVPTGSIIPFIGTVAPNGWLLCNGSTFADNTNTAALKALLGSNTTPDLRSMFLRGAGDGNGRTGSVLKVVQQDDIKSHLHAIVSQPTTADGDHSHNFTYKTRESYQDNGSNSNGVWKNEKDATGTTSTAPKHTHTVSGNTTNTGGSETRPINYGVNYIIKL